MPENNRTLRQRLRTRLGWAGLGWLEAGTWVTPRVDRELEACRVLEELDLLAGSWSFVATAGQVGDERSLVRSAWDLDTIERRYEDFLDLVGRRRPRTDRQALVAQVRLVQEWRRFPLLDPACRGSCSRRGGPATGRPRSSGSGTRPGRRGPRPRGPSSAARAETVRRGRHAACFCSQARPASVMTRMSRSASRRGGSCR